MASWPVLANGSSRLFTWTIPGANRRITVRRDAPGFILVHFTLFFNDLVERLDAPGADAVDEGGFNRRYIAGTRTWSYHARAVAVDLNWQKHPWGTHRTKTFSQRKIEAIHGRMRWMNKMAGGKVIEWGGDWPSHSGSTTKPDPMHWQVNRPSDAMVLKLAKYLAKTSRGKRIIAANPKNKDYLKILK